MASPRHARPLSCCARVRGEARGNLRARVQSTFSSVLHLFVWMMLSLLYRRPERFRMKAEAVGHGLGDESHEWMNPDGLY